MIVGRLAAAARAVVREFAESGILNLIPQAIQLAANRGSMSDTQYQQAVAPIRAEAERIIASDGLKSLPNDIRPLFVGGPYGNALPTRLAQTLISGVTSDKIASMSSAELIHYQEAGSRLLGNLNNMLGAFKALSLDDIVIPENTVSFDLLIPRSAFSNDAAEYLRICTNFVDVVSSIQELVSGIPSHPKLVYTSTSDPVSGFALIMLAATPVLIFYEKILDVAKKQIDLLKAIKSMKDNFPSVVLPAEANVDEKVKQLTRTAAENAVSDIDSTSGIKVDQGRKAELTNSISMKSLILVTAVSNGARLSVTLESQVTIDQDMADRPDELLRLREIIANTKPLEKTVSESLRLLDENVTLLEHSKEPSSA